MRTADRSSARVAITIEARMTSSRLPGKVLADIGGRPALEMMVDRLKQSRHAATICIATTTNADDDPVAALAGRLGIACHRGSEDDVLGRVLGAARSVSADVIVETTGDCPMIDAGLLDEAVESYFATAVDYCSNLLVPGLPNGLDVQVFSTAVLAEVDLLTNDPRDREHVSLYIYEHPDRFQRGDVPIPPALRRPNWRWTIDTAEDLAFVRAVVVALGHDFSALDAVRWLDTHPEVVAINAHISQKPV